MTHTFSDLPLLDTLQATLAQQGLVKLTDIQALALPRLLGGDSVVGIAETGSGKTLTYVLPVLDRLKRLEEGGNQVDLEGEPRAVVLVPSRELGEQVARVFKSLTHTTRLRVRTVLGGQKSRHNRDNVSGMFEVLVATPGRMAKLRERGAISLDALRFVVLDEADQLLDRGFVDTVLELVNAAPGFRQLALFSATMSPEVRELASRLLTDAEIVQTEGSHKVVASLRTEHVDVPDGRRYPALRRVLAAQVRGGTMLFANTQLQCDRLGAWLKEAGFQAVVHRGNMDPKRRRANLQDFRDGRIELLVATDVGARGLDIEHVGRVINVHLPRELETYLHRVGRTARAGRPGLVINLVTPRDAALIEQLDDGSRAPEMTIPPRGWKKDNLSRR